MASKQALLDSDDGDDDITLEINKDYAQKYTTWRQKEELQKLKTKYGEEVGGTSSTSEEEDEDAEALTGVLDKNWFRALAAVRSNDPRIYQKDVKFFNSDDEEEDSDSEASDSSDTSSQNKKKDHKPMYMKDYERKLITEKGGVLSESDEEEEEQRARGSGYYEEQEAIKKSFKSAHADMSSGEEDKDILKKRIKSKKEKAKEEEEYIQFLKGEKEKEDLKKDKDIAEDLVPLKNMYSRSDVNEDEKLLWNIVLDRGFRRKAKAADEDWYAEQMAELHEDEDAIEEQEEFEHKYNFRFEEPDKDFLKGYKRNPSDTIRQKENKRALKRQEIKERKKMEKEKKQEEIRHLKNLKKKEILDKLDQLKKATGNPEVGFSAKDIEEEFDPAAYDKMMQQHYGAEFYEEDGSEKPQFFDDYVDDDFRDDEDWDAWPGPSGSQQEGGDEGDAESSGAGWSQDAEANFNDSNFNMDADYDPSQAAYTSGKKKHKSKFRQIMEKKKPTLDEVFNKYEGSDHPFGDYLDEYYQLDCEDFAGDFKHRFNYHKTVANDYGLSCTEVFYCPERELNAWASLIKMVQLRNEEDEMFEVRKYKKAKMLRKKWNILPSLKEIYEITEPEESQEPPTKKGKKRKGIMKEDDSFEQSETAELSEEVNSVNSVLQLDVEETPKKKRKKQKAESFDDSGVDSEASLWKKKKVKQTDDSELLNQKHKKSKQKVKTGDQTLQSESKHSSEPATDSTAEKKQKKKKKKKAQEGEGRMNSAEKGKKKGKGRKQKKLNGKPKKKGFHVGEQMSSSRLEALRIDPRKFKYTKHKIVVDSADQE